MNLIPARTFPSGDFLCPIVLDIVRRLKRLLSVIGGLLRESALHLCYDLHFYHADTERVCPTIDATLWRGGCYFFTVNLLERQRTLLTDHVDLLRDSVRRVRRLHPFHIDAWVVLPDHMHCIWTLPPDTDDFPMRWRLIKLIFSKGLPRTARCTVFSSAWCLRTNLERGSTYNLTDGKKYCQHQSFAALAG